jgi:hypothetical protein
MTYQRYLFPKRTYPVERAALKHNRALEERRDGYYNIFRKKGKKWFRLVLEAWTPVENRKGEGKCTI